MLEVFNLKKNGEFRIVLVNNTKVRFFEKIISECSKNPGVMLTVPNLLC